MDFGISTCALGEEPLSPTGLERLMRAGFTEIELFANRPHFDYHDRGVHRALADWFRSNSIGLPCLHLPFFEGAPPGQRLPISALADAEDDRIRAIDEIKRALEFTDRHRVSHVVVHLGTEQQLFHPVLFEHAYRLIRSISEFAGVPVLIENIPNEVSTLARLRELLAIIDEGDVGICYDSGHGMLQGPLPKLDGVRAIHLNDNRKEGDDHLWPFDGALNWPELAAELVRTRFRGSLIHEVSSTDIERGSEISERFAALVAEARASTDEFTRKHALREKDDDDNLH